MRHEYIGRCFLGLVGLGTAVAMLVCSPTRLLAAEPAQPPVIPARKVERTIKADVVAIQECIPVNRLGATMRGGMLFALKRDVIGTDGGDPKPGEAQLRPDKRPRPLVLRANVGDLLEITFTDLLNPPPKIVDGIPFCEQENSFLVATRCAGLHIAGLPLVGSINSDGSWVGRNPDSFVAPKIGQTIVYKYFANQEGIYMLHSPAAAFGDGSDAGQLSAGLFGCVIVQPKNSEWYRSQVSEADFTLASGTVQTNGEKHRVVDYDKVYPPGSQYPDGTPIPKNTPILKMLNSDNEIVHSDLTAIITGPKHGCFPPGTFPPDPSYPHRDRPYREITIHYHDATAAITPAFVLGPTQPGPTVSGAMDSFAINYGSAAIVPEIWANRIGVGPMYNSPESKFEEFFLSAWVVGDPAMVVDVPANAPSVPKPLPVKPTCSQAPDDSVSNPLKGPKATKAFYPDDPSNVYHSYLGDRVIFRIVHAGANITHVHHQHAHQWLRTPGSANSTLMDSQTITPGDAYTLEMIYGAGNRNLTPGDSIFHCHFYPHFAAGMWSLWRVHDVFEAGTKLGSDGRPLEGARALPDGEIAAGTPIPALVPIPTIAMAPDPAPVKIVPAKDPTGQPTGGYKAELQNPKDDHNPGYPFFVPGVGGRRPPHPPYDFAIDNGQTLDGGLPRHIVLNGGEGYHQENRFDFTKETGDLIAGQLEETGTPTELKAMAYHQKREHPSYTPEPGGEKATFYTNGSKPRHGAPYADPTSDHFKGPPPKQPNMVKYKGANIQLDVVFNKKGWHYPQQRIITLWGDVKDTLGGARRPEPLFIRAASTDLVEYTQANLVPDYYEMDNFQVRTPTDIIGQHIHLVKFDVLASDGAANGFNYEDGTFSPDDVRKRIEHINATGGLFNPGWEINPAVGQAKLTAKPIPFFGPGDHGEWVGAQATVQLWYADPLLNNEGQDRTLRTVFTHDHFGPSTHQQAGLYAGLIVEPEGAIWKSAEDGKPLGNRDDGGPTSWQAIIEYPKKPHGPRTESFREFALEFQDSQLAYQNTSKSKPVPYTEYCFTPGVPIPKSGWYEDLQANVIKPPVLRDSNNNNLPFGSGLQIISGGQPGTRSVNYRNEPLPLRLAFAPPGAEKVDCAPDSFATDLAHVYRSICRFDQAMNVQPVAKSPINPANPNGTKFSAPFPGANPLDPYTPLLRAYENDEVRIRTLVGAHQLGHSFHIHGLTWLTEPTYPDSGYRSTQGMSISEHFEFDVTLPRTPQVAGSAGFADYLYQPSSGTDGQTSGLWGLLRAYRAQETGVEPLRSNPPLPKSQKFPPGVFQDRASLYASVDPKNVKKYRVTAITASQALKNIPDYDGKLVYYFGPNGTVSDPNGIIYVLTGDLIPDPVDPSIKRLPATARVAPLVLRANAGDLIEVELTNALPADLKIPPVTPDSSPFQFFTTASGYSSKFYDLTTSTQVGLHPQMVDYDITQGNGFNVGSNPVRTVPPGKQTIYQWYAGRVEPLPQGGVKGVPVEFGAINLLPADPLLQHPHGLFACLVIEPEGANWGFNDGPHTTVKNANGATLFEEHVVMLQTDASVNSNVINYRAEPMADRFPLSSGQFNTISLVRATSDELTGGDPHTPIIHAHPDVPFRLRWLQPGGQGGVPNVVLHGHNWQRQPYTKEGTVMGYNPRSEWTGSTGQLVPNDQLEMLIHQPGGPAKVVGDYLYRDFLSIDFSNGAWGLFRVSRDDQLVARSSTFDGQDFTVRGYVLTNTPQARKAVTVTIPGVPPKVVIPDPRSGFFEAKIPTQLIPESFTMAAGTGSVVTKTQLPMTRAAAFSTRIVRPRQRQRESLDKLFIFR
jgi:hypothetical protein